MASTRDINSKGNYCLEQKELQHSQNYSAFYNGPNGHASKPAFPELYRQGYMPPDNFSYNSIDIESALLGIGSTNLVNEKPVTVPQFKSMPTVAFFNTPKVIMPQKFEVLTNQRPFIA